MRLFTILSLILMLSLTGTPAQSQNDDIITQWTFDDTLEPSFGEGMASLIGGTTTHSLTLNSGWRITDFPDQFEGSGTAGAEFMVSTAGFDNIFVNLQHRSSGTMSRWAEIQYTTDGGETWEVLTNNGGALSPHDTEYDFEYDFSDVEGAPDNPLFGVRIVSIFSPVAFNPENPDEEFPADTAYHRAREEGTGGNPYSGQGNWRLLNVTFSSGGVDDPDPVLPDALVLWTFDDTLEPVIGEGTASLIGGTSTHSITLNNGWRITDFPDQFENSGTAGAEFMVSTEGYDNITMSYEHRSSGTMSRWAEIHYTTNGGASWEVLTSNGGALSPHDTEYPFEFNLSSVDGISDNPDFGFRIVSVFSPIAFNPENPDEEFPANTAYHRAREEGTGGNPYSGQGNWRLLNVGLFGEMVTSNEPAADLPRQARLMPNYPNPFNPTTTIRYELAEPSDVSLSVYNITGQRVAVLVNGSRAAGEHTAVFDASGLASGTYIYRLEAAGTFTTRKMMLIK